MNLNKLYDLAEKENIKIYDWHIEDSNGIYINYDKINIIALNYDNLGTYIDEKCILAHELGHYYTDAVYPLQCDNETIIRKQEHKVNKWCYNVLIPYDDLKLAIKNGYNQIHQLADYFNVTCEFMKNCLNFYYNKYGYIC